MQLTPEKAWNECLEIIRDNVSRQSFRTWFEPLRAVRLEQENSLTKLTVQLPSRFYYEWLEEHYFSLLRKTVTKVLGSGGRLFYDIVIERDDSERGVDGTSMHLPARQPANEPGGPPRPDDAERASDAESGNGHPPSHTPATSAQAGSANQSRPSKQAAINATFNNAGAHDGTP